MDETDYVLRGKLGNGAVGLVRRAEDLRTGHRFAVKFLAPDPKYIEEDAFDDVVARFKREGERGAGLSHRSLMKLHAHVDNIDGVAFQARTPKNPFLLMACARGGTVEEYIRRLHPALRGQLVLDETRLSIAIQIAEALEYLHKRKIVHRDVKPGNIFLSSRQIENPRIVARLGDFGVVKWGDFHASLSTGSLTATMQRGLGTMKYMSPEQALRPKDVDSKADVFSFGVTLFELFTGQVLPSFYHVYEIMASRDIAGTTSSRWRTFEVEIQGPDESIAEMILDMVRKGVTRRLTMTSVRGRLEWEYERRTGTEWSQRDWSRSDDDE